MLTTAQVPSTIDIRVCKAMPGNSIVLLPNAPVFTIIAATDNYYATSGRSEEELVGKGMFEAFPGPPDDPEHKGVMQLRTSLQKVVQQKTSDRMPMVRYDIQNGDDTFEERYWSAVNNPVLGSDGAVLYIIHTAEEMTLNVKAAESALAMKTIKKSNDLFMQAPVAIGILKGTDYVVELANDGLLELWDRSEADVLGKPLFEGVPDLGGQGYKELLDQVCASGEPFYGYEHPVRLNRHGKEELLYFDFVYKPYYEEGKAEAAGVFAVGHNVTKQVESRQKFKSVIEEAKDPILILMGQDMLLDTANEAVFNLWQVGPEAVGKPFVEMLPEMKDQATVDLLQQVFNTGEPGYGKEVPILSRRKSGVEETVYFDFSYQPYRNAEGSIAGILVMASDVSSQVQARKNIEESEARLINIISQVNAGIAQTTTHGHFLEANERFCQLTGYTKEELQRLTIQHITHPDDWPRNKELFIEALTEGKNFFIEKRYIRKDGTFVWVNNSVSVVTDNKGEKFITAVSVEITDQMTSRRKLEESESRFRLMADTVPAIIWITEKDASCSYLNKRWYDSTGQTEEEALGFGWLGAVHPDDSERSGKIFMDANAKGEPFTLPYRLRQKDDTYRWAIDRGEPRFDTDGSFAGYIGSVIDMHEQILMEENLRRSEERYRHLFQNSPVSKWDEDFSAVKRMVDDLLRRGVTDFHDYFKKHPDELLKVLSSVVINDVNEAALRMWGGGKEELLTGLQQFFVEDSLLAFIEELTIIGAGGGRFETETTVQSKGGEKANVLVRIDFPKGDDYSSVPVILVNITERKKAEKALKESESRFRTLGEALPQMVWMLNSKGSIEYGSKNWAEYSGIADVSEAWKAIVHPDDWTTARNSWERGSVKGEGYRYDVRLKNREGEYRWHHATGEPIKDADGNLVKWIGAFTDIHAQKTFAEKLENEVAERTRELQNSEKKLEQAVSELERSNEDLQQFAHVASHDLKEPVRKVKTFTSRLEQHMDGKLDETGKKFIERIHSATNRMFMMIDGVLKYSTVNAATELSQPVNLNEIIENIESDLEVIIQKTGTQIKYDALPTIEGAPVLLHQVFYNLINNSIKFAKTDIAPRITISSETIVDKQQPFVKLVLSDNGIGFEDEQATAIFDTFTRLHSKDNYEGTGLGLALCKKVVERHGGRISADGGLGLGATFIILLPLYQTKRSI